MQTKSILATALCFIFLGGSLCAVTQENTTAQGPTTAQSPTTAQGPATIQSPTTDQNHTTAQDPTTTQSSATGDSPTATQNSPTPDDIEAEQVAKARAEEYDRFKRSEQMEAQLEYARQVRALGQYGAPAQNGYAQPQQPIQDSRTRTYSASNYDPAAGPRAQKPSWAGALDAATGHVNPCNHDWGGLLAQWHIAVAQETIENAYFYGCLIETIVLLLFILWVSELYAERTTRLVYAGDVVAQLYNQYVNARNKAYKYIHAYNRLVEQTEDRLDALVRDGAPDNERLSDPPGLSVSTLAAVTSANTMSGGIPKGPVQDPVNDVDTDPPLPAPKDGFRVKPVISVAAIDKSAESSRPPSGDTPSADDIEDELESKRRQIETLQARLQNKNLRINELEDALAVSSNRNKIPEM